MKNSFVRNTAAAMAFTVALGGCAESASSIGEQVDEYGTPTTTLDVERIQAADRLCVADLTQQIEYQSNLLKIEELIGMVDTLAKTVSNQELQAINAFLTDSVEMRINNDNPDLTNLVMIEADKTYNCGVVDYFREIPIFGVYSRPYDTLFLIDNPKEPISDFWRTLLLVHEASHARSRHLNINPDVTEEARTRLLEQDIMRETGGNNYRSALDNYKRRLAENGFNESDGFIISVLDATPEEDELLDRAFGQKLSEREYRLRMSMMLIAALFELIQENAERLGMSEIETVLWMSETVEAFRPSEM